MAVVSEAVRNAARPLNERARPTDDFVVANLKRDFSFHNEKRFIIARMDVRRRAIARRDTNLRKRIDPTGLITGGENTIDISEC